MTREEVLALLAREREGLVRDFGVTQLSLFGSAARNALTPASDIDVLVDFDGPATFDRYFGVKDRLESVFGRNVDVVTLRGLKPRARRQVESELLRVA